MRQYKTVNNITGWIIFAIAATVYCLTIEPTASFWDCPEFITTGYKLEIGHPPGAPFFMLTANLFSHFASSPATVAKMVNTMSALMSGATILFLFWTITHMVRRLVVKDENNITTGQIVTIMGSGIVGALAYTFSDTFWFSAVEAEVYAFSSLFTAMVFWLILKWEDVADQAHSDRFLILITYLTGLSIGVHLLNLLCLPAIVLVYYYKKHPEADVKGSILALLASFVLVAAVLYGIVPGVVKVGGWFELLFVNVFGCPFNTGVVIYILCAFAALAWAIYETYKDENKNRMRYSFALSLAILGIPFMGHGAWAIVLGIIIIVAILLYLGPKVQSKMKEKLRFSARSMNTVLLCSLMLLIGYSSYTLIVLRSVSNPPMDQNSPEDIFTLGDYLSRQQYGQYPLLYGPAYSSRIKFETKGEYSTPVEGYSESKYIRKEKTSPDEKDSYIKIPGDPNYVYAQNMLFPRMWSSQNSAGYKQWVNVKGHDVPYLDPQTGENVMVNIPTQWENMKFFFSYQLNFMYWRYFMWNFVGRQNDIASSGEIEHGNWITGFKAIDKYLTGNQELMPKDLKENKGHNVFYGLPLILGIIGLLWQAYRGRRGIQQFWVVFFLFFMTGIAIVLYLNQTPGQPRERDYAYVGSFYAYAIWIGMGVAGIIRFLNEKLKMKQQYAAALATIICVMIPIQMASQTWDDHDRSGRYVCRDFGRNYLMSMQEKGNPIIFTNGDNDTFPLWYNMDTEGVRTDARVCNLSYLQTDWYIDQMKRPAYSSPSLPINWKRIEYVEGTNEYVPIEPEMKKQIDALVDETNKSNNPEDIANMRKVLGDNPYELKNILKIWARNTDDKMHVIPTDSIVMKVDKNAVLRSGMMIPGEIPDYMNISLKDKHALYKSELMMLEMLANCNWTRPMYLAITVADENRLNMDNHFIQEGLAYRFTPFDNGKTGVQIDSKRMYDNLMHKFRFGGIDKKGIYLDDNVMRMCYTHRKIFSQLITQLMKENQRDKALAALNYCEKVIPAYNVPYDYQNGSTEMAEAYYQLGLSAKGNYIMNIVGDKSIQYLRWYLSMSDEQIATSSDNIQYNLALLDAEVKLLTKYHSVLAKKYEALLGLYYEQFVKRMKISQ
jgi:phage shock protein PspC (stress-responsive transcriptional regulator)